MNRFRGKKKAKEEAVLGTRPSMDAESSGPFKMFGKSKKSQDEPKPDLDFASALPASDDFRTSLLMTGLSARFSMLREQDDPNTKVGKASDDSVLHPNRQSRMMDFGGFGGGGLHDIAEVESLRAPQFNRTHSFQSDDNASLSGSIMNRAKPTDGNNLFGGRQKIYKIATGGASKSGAMSGRALYDDDVAQSSFQKWRQTERTRPSQEEDRSNDTFDSDAAVDFSRRRETSSTTSSGPSVGRNSTAATSITSSHPNSSLRDWQTSIAPNPTPTSPAPGIERSVTRTRRLYEQSLTQDLHDNQSSAVSRMDNLSRQRPLGTRTPELTPPVPSPTTTTFNDRFMDRRPIMGKNSAPNLRSFSPSSLMSPAMPSAKFSGSEQKPNYAPTNPPLSPPISEADDQPMLPIQSNERSSATALGMFNRPGQQYDDSKSTQRRGPPQSREMPVKRPTLGSNASAQSGRSRSSSSQRFATAKSEPRLSGQAGSANQTFFDDSDDVAAENERAPSSATSYRTAERPDDQEHPAFRKSALPTPLSLSSRNSTEPSPLPEKTDFLETGWKSDPPEDSPTLGPATGLSGMVRQHLRNDSEASSVYASTTHDQDDDFQAPANARGGQTPSRTGMAPNPWNLSEADWNMEDADLSEKPEGTTRQEGGKEPDEFARHLADGARRVREKLTSYADSDVERPPPPPVPQMDPGKDSSRQNTLGILRSKSSRGSLFNKRDRSQERPKSSKSQAPSPPRHKAPAVPEEMKRNDYAQADRTSAEAEKPAVEKEEPVHAGLKAFRQARRELQKMKELELQQRHQSPQKMSPTRENAAPPRVGNREGGGPPPALFNRMPSEESRQGVRSNSGSRGPSERDRSGSEASNNGRSHSRPGRLRNDSATYDDQYGPNGPAGSARPSPSMRSPMVHGQSNSSRGGSPAPYNHQEAPQAIHGQPRHMAYETGRASPNTPTNGVQSFFSGNGGSGNGQADTASKRSVRKRDISEPTFVSTTSRVPTVPLEGQQQYSRSRNGSFLGSTASTPNLHAPTTAPPLPPINPRRKNGQGPFMRQSEDGGHMGSPRYPAGSPDDMHAGGQTSDEEASSEQYRQRLRRMTSDSNVNQRGRSSPPRVVNRPPIPHANLSNSSMPGGMI